MKNIKAFLLAALMFASVAHAGTQNTGGIFNANVPSSGGSGGGGGSGTVTSIALTMPGIIFNSTVPGSPITTSGTLAPTLANQNANTFLAGPSTGSATTPIFRAIVNGDFPVLSANQVLGALTATTPSGLTVPSCSTSASALQWTSGTGFGCNTAIVASSTTTNANMTGAITSVGNATSLGSFTSAALASALTDETGNGPAVFANSPVLVTPNLGTPSAVNLTNGTNLPLKTGVSGNLPILSGGTGYNFPNFYPALTNTKNNLSNTRICVAGDSTSYGVGSTGSAATSGQNFPPLAYPAQLANILTSNYGIPAHWNSFMGDQGSFQTAGNSDLRVTQGSSWTQSSVITIGGAFLTATTATNALSFTPTTQVDTFRIIYQQHSGNGSLSVVIDSGAATIQSTSGADGLASMIVTVGSVGNHVVHISEVSSSGAVFVAGVEAWDSTRNWVSVINAAWSGSTSTNWNVSTNAWSPANAAAYTALGCNLTILNLGINDWDAIGGTITPATYSANLQSIISAINTAGSDVLIMAPVPTNPTGNASIATQLSFLSAEIALATANNYPFVNTYFRWQSYAVSLAANLYGDTFTHPNGNGYLDNAYELATEIIPANLGNNSLGGNGGIGSPPVTLNLFNSANPGITVKGIGTGGTPGYRIEDDSAGGHAVNIYEASGFLGFSDTTSNSALFVANSTGLQVGSLKVIGFNSTSTFPTTSPDTAISRESTGVIDIGQGTDKDKTGTIELASVIASKTISTGGYIVSTLPVGTIGMRAFVTDAISCTFLGGLTGGGTTVCPTFYNGTAWVAD